LFIELAETYSTRENVTARWNEWLQYETAVMQEIELRGDRIH